MNKLDIYNLYLLDFAYAFNKTRQTASDVILVDVSQFADGPKEHPLQSNSRLSSLR